MRASKKTAQGLSGAHAYSRLPFVSPVRGHVGIPKQCRQWDKKHLFFPSSARSGVAHIRLILAGGAFPYRQREREAAGGVVTAVPLIGLEPRTRSRVASVAGFFSARCIMTVQSGHWLDYDPVALVVLLVGMSAVAFLVLSI